MNPFNNFINNAKLLHNNRYDYKYVEYIDNKTEVVLLCNKCRNTFEIQPNLHVDGKGCNNCYDVKTIKRTTEEFIGNARKIHGDKYDYSLSEYINNKTKVIIICMKHGKFEQEPNSHLRGTGCSECFILKQTKTIDQFIKDVRKVHGDKYDYSLSEYVNNNTKVIIICKKHGNFEQRPSDHLQGNGCPICSGNQLKTIDQFIKDVRKVHGDLYDYSLASYVNNSTNITIICQIHGKFEQCPNNHLNKNGCPTCSKRNYSQKAIRWLKEMEIEHNTEIQHAENGGEMKIELMRWGLKSSIYQSHFLLDGFDNMNLVCYEFNGCVWHGHNCQGNPDDINSMNNKTFRELYEKTIEKERLIKFLKFKLVSIWECEYDNKMEQNST